MFKNYNMNQLVLPLDLEVRLQENDIAFAVHHLVESIPDDVFEPFMRTTGCPAYHPRMMMKIILCAYTQSVFSGRKIEGLLFDSLRMMWLAQGNEPSYRTINRFRVHPAVTPILKQAFVTFRCHLVEMGEINEEAIFIDGTKLEANANRYTFVWRKSIERHSVSLVEKSNRIYDSLVEQDILPEIERESPDELTLPELEHMGEALDSHIASINQKIEASSDTQERKCLRSERKGPRLLRKEVTDFIERKRRYAIQKRTLAGRNSYSKTDTDATFMRMKEDHMQNGQLKPGYNVQIATEGQYTLAYDIYPNPTDTRTLLPFLDEVSSYFTLPPHIVADAGYWSQENYQDILMRRGRIPLIPYTMFEKEKSRKWRNNPFNTANWSYDEVADRFVCPNGQDVTFRYMSKRTDRYGFTRDFKVYESEGCDDCPLRSRCTKAEEGRHRQVRINVPWEEQKEQMKKWLSDQKTGSLYAKRKIDVEPVFGYLKANLSFTRFSVRGKAKVKRELGFILMAVNLRKWLIQGVARRAA